MFTIADFAFAVATNFDKENFTVTTVSQISYLGTVKGDTLYAETKLIKDGKTVCFYEVDIFDNFHNAIAVVNFNGTHISK